MSSAQGAQAENGREPRRMAAMQEQSTKAADARDVDDAIEMPDLVEIQLRSYRWFLEEGLRELFKNFAYLNFP